MTDLLPISDELSDLDPTNKAAILWLLDLQDLGERAQSRLEDQCRAILSIARECRDTHSYVPFRKSTYHGHPALNGTLFEGHGHIDTFEVGGHQVTLRTKVHHHGCDAEYWTLAFPIEWLWMSIGEVGKLCNEQLDAIAAKEKAKEAAKYAAAEAAERAKLAELKAKYPEATS